MMKSLENKMLFAVALIVGLWMTHAGAESNQQVPPKKPAVIEQKVAEMGTAMKGWAMVFGADLKKSGESTRQAFLNDVERLKQSQFVQYQKKGFEQAKDQLARNKTQIAELFEKLGGFIGRVGKNPK